MTNRNDNQTIALDRWGRSEPLDARKMNQSVDALRDMTRGVAPPRQVVRVIPVAVDVDVPVVASDFQFCVVTSNTDYRPGTFIVGIRLVVPDWVDTGTRFTSGFRWRVPRAVTSREVLKSAGGYGTPVLTNAEWNSFVIDRLAQGILPGASTLTVGEKNKICIAARMGTWLDAGEPWERDTGHGPLDAPLIIKPIRMP